MPAPLRRLVSATGGRAFGGSSVLALCFALSLGGCHRGHDAQPPGGATDAAEQDPRARRLAALADEIDAKRQPAIAANAPVWLRAALSQMASEQGAAGSAEVSALVRSVLDGWMARPSFAVDSPRAGLGLLAMAVLLGEDALLSGDQAHDPDRVEGLLALTRIYGIFDESYFANERGFLQQSFSTMLAAASSQGLVQEQQQMEELLGFLNTTLRSMPQRHAHATALLLRVAPQDDRVLDAVAHRARRAQENGEAEKALGYYALIAEYRPQSAVSQADLAQAQIRALELQDAREQLVVVQAVTTALVGRSAESEQLAKDAKTAQDRLATLEADLAKAAKIVELGGEGATPATSDAAAELCNGLFDIGRLTAAGACFERAGARFADDARFATGYGRVLIARDLDMGGAAAVADAARSAKHKDREYYELYFGAHSSAILLYLLPRIAQDPSGVVPAARQYLGVMRGELPGYEALAPERAQTLGALYAGVDFVLSKMGGDTDATLNLLRDAAVIVAKPLLATRDAFPGSYDAARVALVATRFVGDDKLIGAHLRKKIEIADVAKRDEALLLRAKVARDLGIVASRMEYIDLARSDVASLSPSARESPAGRRMAAELQAVKAMLSQEGAEEALAALQAVAQAGGGSPSLSVSIAVLRAETGDLDGARRLLEEVLASVDEEQDVVRLNLLRLAEGPKADELMERFEASTQGVGFQLARTAKLRPGASPSAAKKWTDDYAKLLAQEITEGRIAKGASPDLVALTKGKLDVSVNYSTKDRMDIRALVESELWMLVPAAPRRKR